MPIRAATTVDIREQIALMALSGNYTITEIADLFDVTRPTVYRYRDRYRSGGRSELVDRSRAPHHRRSVDDSMKRRVLAERERFGFGSKKIRQRLLDEDADAAWPARSTIDEILRRAGVVRPRRRRLRYDSPFRRRFSASEPGQLSAIDFKGEFRLRSGRWCYPLTMTDAYSRYMLACQALPSTRLAGAWPVIERIFREYGLPDAILSDNGPPFGPHGSGRLSSFSVRLMELGIQPLLIAPGHPEQNGSHERMHRSLLESPFFQVAPSFRRQQQIFDAFRTMYNHERPHEGIDMQRPAGRYHSSPRPFPSTPPKIDYPVGFDVRLVTMNGTFKWRGTYVFLASSMAGRAIGLQLVDDQLWDVYFSRFLVGRFHERERRVL